MVHMLKLQKLMEDEFGVAAKNNDKLSGIADIAKILGSGDSAETIKDRQDIAEGAFPSAIGLPLMAEYLELFQTDVLGQFLNPKKRFLGLLFTAFLISFFWLYLLRRNNVKQALKTIFSPLFG